MEGKSCEGDLIIPGWGPLDIKSSEETRKQWAPLPDDWWKSSGVYDRTLSEGPSRDKYSGSTSAGGDKTLNPGEVYDALERASGLEEEPSDEDIA